MTENPKEKERADEKRAVCRMLLRKHGEAAIREDMKRAEPLIALRDVTPFMEEILADLDAERKAKEPAVIQGWITIGISALAMLTSIVALYIALNK